MKIFEFNGRRIVEFNGDLYLQLEPIDVAVATTNLIGVSEGKHRQPYNRRPRHGRPPGRKNTQRLEPDDVNRIMEQINAGYKAAEIAPKFGVSAQYIYLIKTQMKKKGELTLTEPV